MQVERIRKQTFLVRPLIGVAILAASAAASGQQQGQEQSQGDVRVAVGGGAEQQPQQAMWSEVRVIHVKSDHVAAFEDLIKELGAALSKQGTSSFNVWQVAFGDQNTYHIVTPLESFASLPQMQANPPMEPQQWANWLNRIQATIDSQVLSVAQVHPDMSIMPQEQAGAAAPELLILVSQTLMPGKRQQYMTWVRDDLMPALKKSGIPGVVTNEMAFGSQDREWVFALPIQNWSQLDKPMPLYTSMGQQAAEQLLNQGDQLVARGETIVLRTRPDLSVAAPQSGQGEQPAGQQQRPE